MIQAKYRENNRVNRWKSEDYCSYSAKVVNCRVPPIACLVCKIDQKHMVARVMDAVFPHEMVPVHLKNTI